MKLKELYSQIKETEEDFNPEATGNLLRFFDLIQKSPKFTTLANSIRRPTDKYKAVVKFAGMVGIPEEKLVSFISNQNNLTSRERQ